MMPDVIGASSGLTPRDRQDLSTDSNYRLDLFPVSATLEERLTSDYERDDESHQERISREETMKTGDAKVVNGFDTSEMFETIDAIKAQPSLARFQFRASNQWISGGENRSTIKDFYGAGREDASRKAPFVFTNGEPPVLLGDNEGANPVEFLLHSLAGCVTTTIVLHAAARGIRIEEMSTQLEGNMDLQGLLGLDDSVSPSYEEIRIKINVKADCSDEELDDLLGYAQDHSPVCNTVCRPIPVKVERVGV
jgi:uncharacterized OsmC-like protein